MSRAGNHLNSIPAEMGCMKLQITLSSRITSWGSLGQFPRKKENPINKIILIVFITL